ncbi:OPT oligopeptide transporter [Hygrophoropsis aurantiaca]|uniref:OPT oligopeptide transporter n=1 Tax=Hygrophoropsis aurantiaca TaxID=72124 RepID=A0ACB8ASE2_9AGAM|nr:OPT oligopeptide transporter [Hygrophoropsis aurantiaca]
MKLENVLVVRVLHLARSLFSANSLQIKDMRRLPHFKLVPSSFLSCRCTSSKGYHTKRTILRGRKLKVSENCLRDTWCERLSVWVDGSALSLLNFLEFDDPNLDKEEAIVGILDDDSPYPEVRSAVANADDFLMPVSTIRSWTMGLIWAAIISGLNQFFYMRYPSLQITGVVGQLLSFPMGRAWARFIPNVKIFGVSINPGPFTIKEHVLITIMATVGYQTAYATDIIAVQRFFYNQKFGFAYQWMMVMSTQLLGFSMGGVMRRFLVEPPSMIWPSNLVTCALFNTLHSTIHSGASKRNGMSRERFFMYVFVGGCVWYIFPGYLFQALSYFSWVCWIFPDNVVVNQLFGYQSGLGMSLLTFDWAQINFLGTSPLATPWWAEANILVGFVFFYWILTPIFYYTNTWYTQYLPVLSRSSFDNTGSIYNFSRILTPENRFNETAYKEYSPLFLSTTYIMSYSLSFASITSTIVHAFLFFRKQIWAHIRLRDPEQSDVHARLMARYRRVPEWWYIVLFAITVLFGVFCVEVWPTEFPVWALLVSVFIAFLYIIPIGMVQAITNQQVSLNVLTEMVVGYALPGRPLATMMFKTWGFITMAQALQFASDLKLGHYMKIPPRTMFWAQIWASVIAGTVQLGVQSWMFSNIPDMCALDQKDGFMCPYMQVFGTASIIWGVIGPQRQFSVGQMYDGIVWFFLVGALCPMVAWMISIKWPSSFVRYVSFPVIFTSITLIPPATALNFVPWTIVGFIFQFVIRRRHLSWWMKYNFVLSAALDCGLAVGIVVVFFALQYPQNGTIGATTIAKWWGNTVFLKTADGKGVTYRPIPESGTFGPTKW